MLNFELKEALVNNRLAHSLEQHELNLLTAHSKLVSFSPGTIIIKQGTKSEGIYLILVGSVIIAGQIVGEGITNLASLGQGRIFGGSSVVINGPNATSVIAETEVKCLFIPSNFLEMLTLFYPSTKYKVMQELVANVAERIKIVIDKIMVFMSSHEMIKRPVFGEIIKSMTKPSLISFEEAGVDLNELRSLVPPSLFEEMKEDFFKNACLIKTASQCTLIQNGEKNASAYLVLRGAVQSSVVKQNKVAKISILGPQALFCPLSFLDKSLPSLVNYTSCEQAILLKFEKSILDKIQTENSKLWYKIFDLMVESYVRLGRYAEKLEIRINSEIYNR